MGRYLWPPLPASWPLVRLKDCVSIAYGKALTVDHCEGEGLFNVYGSSGVVGTYSEYLHAGPSIIIGRKGNVGSIYYADKAFWCIDTAFYVKELSNDIDIEYLVYLLRYMDLARLAIVVAVPGLNRQDLESLEIPLPPLPEQKRIVAILKETDQLCNQWQETLTQARQLPASLFIEMFGDPDPRLNQKWDVTKLGAITQVETGGTPSRTNPAFYTGEIPWVKSTELVDRTIDHTEEMISDAALKASNAKTLPIGTVLLAMYGQGQTRGRTGLLTIEATCNQACAAILPTDQLLPPYIFVWLQCSYQRIRALGRGGQQPNLNLSIVKSLQIPKPPLEIQEQFCERLALLEAIQQQSNSITKQYEELLTQITSNALSGQLTEKWRSIQQQALL